ncbi:MAG: Transcription elongation factor GreA [candidate division WS6 bacterium GW2011_GWE1_34_7]|uniref:Transcription elongation factor GreA n=1 Tax=candidate division WS6 bacterium GW2011_GWE1_34_7 TaxID=1619093 RepID=A0A0G0B6J2_9BACT|nr:MAG: Transcription elongation factor GreA [candidate division WS6 bacterium GW2011_GWE1_34_7]
MTKKQYQITEEKQIELVQERKQLQEKDLIDVANRLEESRENDSDEDDAMLGVIAQEKQSLEKRIKEISNILENCELIEEKRYCEPDKISLGSKIKLKDGNKIFEVKLVSSLEADPSKSYISNRSPLGRKLITGKVGETITLKVRGNTVKYKILEIC